MDPTTEISKLLEQAIKAEDRNDHESAKKLHARCLALEAKSRALRGGSPGVRCRAWLLASAFRQEHGDMRGAFGLLRRAIGRWPKVAMLHSLLGGCFLDVDHFVAAERAYRRAVAIRPEPWTLSLLAHSLREQGREEESTHCLHEVLALDPNYEEAHYNLGCALRRQRRWEEAIERFERAIAIDPAFAEAHAELGYALLQLTLVERSGVGGLEQPHAHLVRSVELDPEYYWSRIYLAICCWELERIREARVHYEAAWRIDPESGFALALYANFLSSAYGSVALAEAHFREAIELDPECASVRFYYGKHLLRTERLSAARNELLLADRLGHTRALEVLHAAERPA